MSAWFAEWLAKPRHWVLWLIAANFASWGVFGLGVVGLYFLFKVG